MADYLARMAAQSALRLVPKIFAWMLAGYAAHFEAWRASDIAGPPDLSPRFVMLQAKTGGEGIVNTATVRKLIDIKDRIEHAAAYARTEFYLASGNDGPNAYATVIENGPVIGFDLGQDTRHLAHDALNVVPSARNDECGLYLRPSSAENAQVR